MANRKLSDPIPSSEIVLTKVRKGMAIHIGDTAIDSLQIREDYLPHIAGKIVQATFDVLADKIVDDHYTTYFTWKTPKTPWQLLKKQKAPKWFKRKFPVRYKNHTYKRLVNFTRYAEYPKANIVIPKTSKIFIQSLGELEVIRDIITEKGTHKRARGVSDA